MQTQTTDVLIIGAGVFGLSIAYEMQQQGYSVHVLDKAGVGSGASGGILGALMPHVPDQWNPKKQFQFEALDSLSTHAATLQERTGIDTGYRRCGRIIPLLNDNDRTHALHRQTQSMTNWQGKYDFQIHEGHTDWTTAQSYVVDTLAATIDPQLYIKALAQAVGHANITQNEAFTGYDDKTGTTVTQSGRSYQAGHTILAAGYDAFAMLEPYYPATLGQGIKGQASLLRLRAPLQDPLPPVLYADGVYVIARTRDLCAVGSTSEKIWDGPDTPTFDAPPYLEKAKTLCPPLQNADLVTHWAGVRPKARRRDPMVGQVHGTQSLYVATGGFKIGLGIAHMIAKTVKSMLTDTQMTTSLPESFTLEAHLIGLQKF